MACSGRNTISSINFISAAGAFCRDKSHILDDDNVFTLEPIPANIDFMIDAKSVKHVKPVKHFKLVTPVKTTEQTEKSKNFSSSPKVDGKNGMGKLPKNWVFTRSGRIPVSAAKPKAAASTSAAKPVNAAGPKQSVNFSRTRSTFHKSHSSIGRSFYNATLHSRRNSSEKVNTVGSKAVSDVKGNRVTAVKTSTEGKAAQSHLALVTKTHTKTPYELLNGRSPRLDFIRPFGCHITILNTLDPLGKFKGKADEGFLAGKGSVLSTLYCVAIVVFYLFHYKSSDDKPADDKPKDDTSSKIVEKPINKEDQAYKDELDRLMSQEKEASNAVDALRKEFEQGCMDQRGVTQAGSTNSFNTVTNPVNAVSTSGTFSADGPSSLHLKAFIPANTLLHIDQDDSQILDLEETTEL
nr:retrovirus-related Pol polyprotein from transposon TNT 1-94 [Tanacetum cinerariifolium]